MIQSVGIVSYSLAAAGFTVLLVLLTVNRSPGRAGWFIAAIAAGALWSFGNALLLATGSDAVAVFLTADALRDLVLIAVLGHALALGGARTTRSILTAAAGVLATIAIVAPLLGPVSPAAAFAALLGMQLLGLLAIEQVYRNASARQRRALRTFALGIGSLLAYDLFLFSNAVLLGGLDKTMLASRGLVAAAAVPLLVVAAKRYPVDVENLFVSRQMAFYTATFVLVGAYLVAMSAAGAVIRLVGGQWGLPLQAAFMVLAFAVLAVVLFSAKLSARMRVFLAKHFYRNRYDYREEWLRLTATLAGASSMALADRCVRALGDIVASPSGQLWCRSDSSRDFRPLAAFGVPRTSKHYTESDPLIDFLTRTLWVVDTVEYRRDPERYENAFAEASGEVAADEIIVPLVHNQELLGLAALARPPGLVAFNYEDHDLLKTAGRQVAAFLAEDLAQEMLAHTRQFEAYNKLSAFLMHDLKNLVAQQSLLVSNAGKHKRNERFIDDMVATVEVGVTRMRRLLEQLERGRTLPVPVRVDVAVVAAEVVALCQDREPRPVLRGAAGLIVAADRDRLSSAIAHTIRNAQDATPSGGSVDLTLSRDQTHALIEVRDSGAGMDQSFIDERLFKPFDTTKGARGMGIGAYQVQEFVTEAGGQVSVRSTKGVGTVFRIRLPLLDAGETRRARSA